ncbi:DAPG hydrolase family protein [Hydrogenophaga sp.]|uniref:DAPG hydrolase family protein n=1 Tax=Hydrogenophaga sp. TaxID=1904254 RepID=UPI003D1102A7
MTISWHPRSVDSARSGIEVLPDGRLRCWIEHDTLRGVTPPMLAWWFRHLEGEMDFEGQRLLRYHVWHPRDHVQVSYTRRLADGSVGVGAQLHIVEVFGGNPRHRVDALSDIVRLDEQGFGHRPRWHGLRAAAMDYRFEPVPGGTRYVNSLTVGFASPWARPLNALMRRFVFDAERARAWIRHNVEEVGQFERFLPALFASETDPRP